MDNGNQPATKGDLAALEDRVGKKFQDLEDRVGKRFQDLEDRVGKRFQDLEDRVSEAIHDAETRLLKAFYTVAESNQVRLAQVENTTNAVITRLATLESRVTDVEKRLN